MTEKSLRSFSVFVKWCCKIFYEIRRRNQLWSNKYHNLRVCISIVAPLDLPYFAKCLITCTIFRKLYWTKNVFWFSLQRVTANFLIPRRPERDIIINVYRSSLKVSVILVHCSYRALWYIKTLVTPTNVQLYSLCIRSITYLLHVSALSPSSGGLHKTKKKNRKRT